MATLRSLSTSFAAIVTACMAVPVIAHPGLHHDIDRVSTALAAQPRRADLYLERGFLHRLNDEPAKALADLEQAATLDPALPNLALHRGLTLSALRRDPQAEVELTKAVADPGAPAAAWMERGKVRERLGRLAAAAGDYAAAIRLDPQPDAYLLHGRLLEALGRSEDAAACYRDGLSRLGGAVALRLELIGVETRAKRYDAALEQIDLAMRSSGNKVDWLLRRGDVNAAAGRPDVARRDREQALADCRQQVVRRPSSLRLYQRARAYHALGRRDEAIADLKAALRKTPRYGEARALLSTLESDDALLREARHAMR